MIQDAHRSSAVRGSLWLVLVACLTLAGCLGPGIRAVATWADKREFKARPMKPPLEESGAVIWWQQHGNTVMAAAAGLLGYIEKEIVNARRVKGTRNAGQT